ncbi:MAG: Sua5/YciO/YrdC/YwlC family protein [Gammaproteobacteria bacterium]|nr:Sua5/YciO/YrdC/YwlC family protein [Gammaproteobacteria bacterium]
MPAKNAISAAADVVTAAGIIAYPTEAVFGLGCRPDSEAAVTRILELKNRPIEAGLILIAADFAQLKPFITELSKSKMKSILETWPGPTTWVLPADPKLPHWITGGRKSVAVRVTSHSPAALLCESANTPIVSTSANPTGRLPARSAQEVRSYFPEGVDYILDLETGGLDQPSEIRDAQTGNVIRAGSG